MRTDLDQFCATIPTPLKRDPGNRAADLGDDPQRSVWDNGTATSLPSYLRQEQTIRRQIIHGVDDRSGGYPILQRLRDLGGAGTIASSADGKRPELSEIKNSLVRVGDKPPAPSVESAVRGF